MGAGGAQAGEASCKCRDPGRQDGGQGSSAQPRVGRAGLCFLNSENLRDFFNPPEPPWPPRLGTETEPDCLM